MTKTEYLYGIKPSELDKYSYYGALRFKLESAIALYKKLTNLKKQTEDEHVRTFFVWKAVTHTRKLLLEKEEM